MLNVQLSDLVAHKPLSTVWIPQRYDARVVCGKCEGSGRVSVQVDGLDYHRACPICEGRNWGLNSKQYYVYNEYQPKQKTVSRVNITLTDGGTDVRYNVLYDSVITFKPEEVFSTESACKRYCDFLNNSARKDAEKHVWKISD